MDRVHADWHGILVGLICIIGWTVYLSTNDLKLLLFLQPVSQKTNYHCETQDGEENYHPSELVTEEICCFC